MVNWLYLTVFDNGNATGFDKLKYQNFLCFLFQRKKLFLIKCLIIRASTLKQKK